VSSVDRVVVVGGDAAAWLAANSLFRAFRHRGLQVTVVDTGPGTRTPGARWTLPSQRGMHALIGVQEPDFVRRTGATYKLAAEHLGWQGDGSRFMHAHGEIGTAIGVAPFYKFLLRELIAGHRAEPAHFSLAATAAGLGRFARPMGEASELTSSFTYGFHVDEAAYVAFLRDHAARAGVRRIEGAVASVDRTETARLRGLHLSSGEIVEGDLYIDCVGLTESARDDWSAWLPCDRMAYAIAPPLANPPPVTRTTASVAGWTWRVPLAAASAVGHVYSSAFMDDDAALAILTSAAPEACDARVVARFRSGRRHRPWEHNCVALGAAALELEPLAGADLHFAQLGIATLIELFPLDAEATVEGVEYNRVMGEHAVALRDFTIAHYRAGRARPGEFWNATRTAPLPETLAHKLDLYGANGRIDLRDHESFEEVDWAWLLLGAGNIPRALEMQMTSLLETVTAEQMEPLRTHIERLAASMPRHIEYVQHLMSAPARGTA
jgi:tryptophan 7-halogenase